MLGKRKILLTLPAVLLLVALACFFPWESASASSGPSPVSYNDIPYQTVGEPFSLVIDFSPYTSTGPVDAAWNGIMIKWESGSTGTLIGTPIDERPVIWSITVNGTSPGIIKVGAEPFDPTIITSEPTDADGTHGGNASFSVAATGTTKDDPSTGYPGTLSYQWYKGSPGAGTPLADGGNVSGATTDTLSLTNLAPADQGAYYCVATSSIDGGRPRVSAASAAATLTLLSATAGNVTISGTAGLALAGGQTTTLTIANDTVRNAFTNEDVSGWFANLPAGLTVVADAAAGGSLITLTFGGTPTAVSVQPFAITIPASALTGNSPIPVTANPDARFDIARAPQPPSPLPKTGDGFPMGVLLALLGCATAALVFLGIRLRKQRKMRKD